jgi:NAD(P)-dependent dehydrogenase (short-subunit alcohol dehydrogenase family)
MGRAIATSLARRGCHLALADIDDDGLQRTAAEIIAGCASAGTISMYRMPGRSPPFRRG